MATRDNDIKPEIPSDAPQPAPGQPQPPVFAVPPTSFTPQFTADPTGQQSAQAAQSPQAAQQFPQPVAPQQPQSGMAAYVYDPRQGWVLVNQPVQPMPSAFVPQGYQQSGQPLQSVQAGQPDQQMPAAQPVVQTIIGGQTPQPASIGASPAAASSNSATGDEIMLLGTYAPKIDAKGRMALPAKFRSQLGPGVVMARGQERCVYLFPQTEFRRVAMQIQRTSLGNKAAREYLRVFLSGAVDQTPDKQGRVLVPQMLRDYAKLGDDIVVIGVGTRAEIWNRQAWEQYLADNEQGYSDIANDVLPTMEW